MPPCKRSRTSGGKLGTLLALALLPRSVQYGTPFGSQLQGTMFSRGPSGLLKCNRGRNKAVYTVPFSFQQHVSRYARPNSACGSWSPLRPVPMGVQAHPSSLGRSAVVLCKGSCSGSTTRMTIHDMGHILCFIGRYKRQTEVLLAEKCMSCNIRPFHVFQMCKPGGIFRVNNRRTVVKLTSSYFPCLISSTISTNSD